MHHATYAETYMTITNFYDKVYTKLYEHKFYNNNSPNFYKLYCQGQNSLTRKHTPHDFNTVCHVQQAMIKKSPLIQIQLRIFFFILICYIISSNHSIL